MEGPKLNPQQTYLFSSDSDLIASPVPAVSLKFWYMFIIEIFCKWTWNYLSVKTKEYIQCFIDTKNYPIDSRMHGFNASWNASKHFSSKIHWTSS